MSTEVMYGTVRRETPQPMLKIYQPGANRVPSLDTPIKPI